MSTVLMSNGRLILAGGKPLTATLPLIPTQSLALPAGYPTVSNSIVKPVFQRKAGQDYGDVPVLFSYTGGTPANVQARVVDADNGTVIKDWTSLTAVQVNASSRTGLGYLPSVPIGCEYLLQIRDGNQIGNGATTSNGTQRWGVGVYILLVGQSNMLGALLAGSYADIVPGTAISEHGYWLDTRHAGVYFGVDGFVAPQNESGAVGSSTVVFPAGQGFDTACGGGGKFLRLVPDALKVKYGRKIPVAMTPWAFTGIGLESLTPPGGDHIALFTNNGNTLGAFGVLSPSGYWPGDFEGVILHQGEANNGQARATRLASLKAFYQSMLDLVAPHGRTANDLFFHVAVLGSYTQVSTIETIRAAAYDLEAYAQANGWPKVRAGWNCIDLDAGDSSDGLHAKDVPGGNPYASWSNRRLIQEAIVSVGCATYGGAGPKISGVTRAGNTATVTVAHEGGTTIAGRSTNPLSGWYANTAADFSGTDIAVTAAVASANTVAVTFPNGTTFPAYLKYMGGKVGTLQSQHPDTSNPVYDNAPYPTGATGSDRFVGLPLQPTPDAIQVI